MTSARVTASTSGDIGARCLAMARRVLTCCNAGVTELAFEWPQVYRGAKSKGDPNDLPGLAGVGMAVAGMLPGLELVRSPTPAQWSGQLPKSTTGDPWASPRGQRVRSRLSPAELGLVQAQHDAIDAVAIGLWALGRLAPRRVFPGAT